MNTRDLWLGDVRTPGQPNPDRVAFLARLLRSRHNPTFPAVTVRVSRRGKLSAGGDYAADRVAALREVYAGTLERRDRRVALGRVKVEVQR